MCRRCGEPDRRGPARERRKRRQWLVDEYGDGQRVQCSWQIHEACPVWLTASTLEVDRIVPGHDGGTYRRDNILPACPACNKARAYRDDELPDGCYAGYDWPEGHYRRRRAA